MTVVRSATYILAVAVIAAVGFTQHSAWVIVVAALLAIPASALAVPGYYVAYGLLALVPGANPSSNNGSSSSNADGVTVTSVTTGAPAAWFTITTTVLGILALTGAAVVNVLVLRAVAARRHRQRESNPR